VTDDVKGFRERIAAAMERIAAGHSPMRIPADMTDPDIVLSDCLARIEGEAARTAAAVAAAREEQREACATRFNEQRRPERPLTKHEVYEAIRATPLTAKPLSDRIAEMEREHESLRAQLAAMDGAKP
jgi:hypothetical protein